MSDAFSVVGGGLNSHQRRNNQMPSIGGSSFSAFNQPNAPSVAAQNRQADRLKQGKICIAKFYPGRELISSLFVCDLESFV